MSPTSSHSMAVVIPGTSESRSNDDGGDKLPNIAPNIGKMTRKRATFVRRTVELAGMSELYRI